MEMKKGPKAPKDPTKKRQPVYLMLNDNVEGSPCQDGRFMDICYLEGRVSAKVKVISPNLTEKIADGLQIASSFRKMVHSIGITIIADSQALREASVEFGLYMRQKNSYDGTAYKAEVQCDGSEKLILIDSLKENPDDTVLSSIQMFFPCYMTGKTTVTFYMNDGYDVPEVTIDPPVAFESDEYKHMIAGSLMHMGNTYRIKRAIEKARTGQDVTIAYIGGSITQGAGAKPINTECYAYQSYCAFRKMYGKDSGENVHYSKAGVGGTCSELGLTRYDTDILKNGAVDPDIVIIEFAVNDAGDETNGVCYESLCLKALEGLGNPAVILLFSVFMDDYNLQDNLSKVGFHYDLPMVSVKNALVKQFYQEIPVMTKRQYFYDLYHPTNEGHKVMADCLAYYFEQAGVADQNEKDIVTDKPGVIGNTYRKLQTITRKNIKNCSAVRRVTEGSFYHTDSILQCVERDMDAGQTPQFPDNWMHCGGEEPESFRLEITCKDLLIIFKDSGDRKVGRANVVVNGEEVRTLDPLETGWVHCTAYIIANAEQPMYYQVEVKLDPTDGSHDFTILGFGYTME